MTIAIDDATLLDDDIVHVGVFSHVPHTTDDDSCLFACACNIVGTIPCNILVNDDGACAVFINLDVAIVGCS